MPQVSTYLPSFLPKDQIYQPDAPKPEDVAVLLEGDEDVDLETLRTKGEEVFGGRLMIDNRFVQRLP